MLIMYFITSIICAVDLKGINVNEKAIDETIGVVKMIFTPLNAMIALASIGNTFGKVKDKVLDTDKAGKRLIIILIAFIVILVFETNYIRHFINGTLSLLK